MTLVDLLNTLIGRLNALIRATRDGPDRDKLTKLRDALDAMSDQAVLQLFETNSDDFTTAVAALKTATADAEAGLADVTRVGAAIKSTVAAARATDKLVGFLAHLG